MRVEQDYPGRSPGHPGGRKASESVSPARSHVDGAPSGAFAQIEAEGARERWLLARRTAQAVFTDPAAVTPRRMSLLGEQGLARFVDDIRGAAQFLIRRERERLVVGHINDVTSAIRAFTGVTRPDPVVSAKLLRRPAAFGAVAPIRSLLQLVWLRRSKPSEALQCFAKDVLIWTVLLVASVVGMLVFCRLLILSFF